MNKKRERKLIERSIIFAITLLGVAFFMIFDFGFVYTYRIDGYRDLQWFSFWTHLSNSVALIWITLALIAVVIRSDKLEDKINHWNVKNTIYTFIITTGVAFMVFAYIPVVISYSSRGNVKDITDLVFTIAYNGQLKEAPIWNLAIIQNFEDIEVIGNVGLSDKLQLVWEIQKSILESRINSGETLFHLTSGEEINIDPSSWYRACVIIGTTFKHLIIPGMFIYLGVTELGYTGTKGMSDFNRSMIQFIWPAMYLVYVITITSAGLVNPPYPVVNLGFTYDFYERSLEAQCISALVYAISDLGMGVLFVGTSYLQNIWNTKNKDKLINNNSDNKQMMSLNHK